MHPISVSDTGHIGMLLLACNPGYAGTP